MKTKCISILLILLIIFIFGCNGLCFECIDNNNDKICDKCGKDLNKGKYYSVIVTGHTETLMEEIKEKYKAGTKVEIKASPVTDMTLHVFIDGEELGMSHFDYDYWGYEFIMPEKDIEIFFTFDQFYGKDEYTFNELYYWVNNLNNVNKIKVYNSKNSFDKFSEVYYITNKDVINNMKNILNQTLVKTDFKKEYINCERTTIEYYVNEDYYSVELINNIVYWYDFSTSQMFRFKDDNYILPSYIMSADNKTYKFEYNGFSSDIKKMNDDSFVERFYNINAIEFIPYEGNIDETICKYYLDSKYGKIELISPNIFKLKDVYYEVVEGNEYWAYNIIDIDK